VFCGYGVASHFPNCYDIPGMNRKATATRRQQYFNRQWRRIVADLNPKYAFPFAADVAFFEADLFWINEATHNSERPTDAFRHKYPQSKVQVVDIAPGFVIENGKILHAVIREPVRAQDLERVCGPAIEQANHYGNISEDDVSSVFALIQAN